MFKEYKVLRVSEGGCSTLLFGSANIPQRKLEQELNVHAANGWTVVFQVTERTRFLLLFSRDSARAGFRCIHTPTCSEYTHTAILEHGLVRGLRMGYLRIRGCREE